MIQLTIDYIIAITALSFMFGAISGVITTTLYFHRKEDKRNDESEKNIRHLMNTLSSINEFLFKQFTEYKKTINKDKEQ